MDKQYKNLEKEKKVSALLKRYDNLTSEEIVFLIDFFIALKNKELRTNIPYKMIDTKEGYVAEYDELENIMYLNKNKVVDVTASSMSINAKSIISTMSTINHEFRHVKQFMEFKNDALINVVLGDPKNILFAKEHLTNEIMKRLDMGDNYKLNYDNMLFEHDANYHSIKNTATWLSFFSPNLTKQYMLDNHDEYYRYRQLLEEFETVRQVSEVEVQRTICKTTLFTDAALMQNPKILKEFPILKAIYHFDGSKKTYTELMHDKTDLSDKVLNEANGETKKSKLNSIDKFYETVIKSDPILTIEKKLDDVEKGIVIGRDSKALDKEVNMIISAVSDMDAQFYNYIKDIIDMKIKNYQNIKQALNKSFTEKLKSLTEDEYELTNSLRKNWLSKSEVITRQQEILVNIFNSLNQHKATFKEKENAKLITKTDMTLKEAERILKEKFSISKKDLYIFLSDGNINYKVPNFEMKKMLIHGVDSLLQILNTTSNQKMVEAQLEIGQCAQIKQAIELFFNFDKKDTKENSIKTSISILNSIYEKLETEKLEEFDRLFEALSLTSRYLLSLDEKLEFILDGEVINISRFNELIINGESYVKGVKSPKDLEIEKVSLIHKTNDIVIRNKIETKYNEYIDESSIYFEFEHKKSR